MKKITARLLAYLLIALFYILFPVYLIIWVVKDFSLSCCLDDYIRYITNMKLFDKVRKMNQKYK